jgi:IS5 family transposase
MFYDALFRNLKLSIPASKTGRKGFPKEAMLCAFIVMKCEGFTQITDLADYLNNNRLIAYYCGFNIMEPLPSYWTYDRFLKTLDHTVLEEVMASQVKLLFDAGIVDASFIGLDSTPVAANTKLNNPKSFAKNKFSKENHPKSDPDCALGVHTASNQQNERNFEFYWGYKSHVLVDCISGLPLYELTTPANVADSTVAKEILDAANRIIPLKECTFIADKGYDVTSIYDHVRTVYEGDCFIPLNKRGTKTPEKLPSGNPICEAGLAMSKDGKTPDGHGGLRQKFCCPFRQSKSGECPCDHKNWNNGKKNRGCTKYSAIPDGYRLSINRDCKQFKRIYALRTECERYNSRFKATGQDRLWIRNGNSAANLNTIAHITALAVAYAAVVTRENVSYRGLKALRRSA